MKQISGSQGQQSDRRVSAGPEGSAIAPPAYGIDFLDHGLAFQRKADPTAVEPANQTHTPNQTGLPDGLKAGVEGLSGLSLDDVRVHYNSSSPAQLQALAYTQGSEIHVAPGQERHIPHEAWHVVQQKQGRVKPTMTLRGTAINDDTALEKEADAMGAKGRAGRPQPAAQRRASPARAFQHKTVQRQRKLGFEMEDAYWRTWKKTWGTKAPYWKSPDDRKNCRPMKKRELLHQGAGFKMEADEFVDNGQLLSDIEFVTDPFPLTDSGAERLETAITEIGEIYETIIPLRGRDHREGEFVKNNESGFSVRDAMLSKGRQKAALNLQATQGFSLQDIPKAFEALSKPAAEAEVPGIYAVLQHSVVGDTDATTNRVLEPLRSATERAWRITFSYLNEHLDETVVDEPFDLTEEEKDDLFGFVTAVIGFVRMMRNPRTIQGGAKTYTPMMHRNDFATLFGMLSGRLRELLRGNRQVFIDALIAGVVADIESDDPLEEYDPEEHRDEFIFSQFILEREHQQRFFEPRQNLVLPNFLEEVNQLSLIYYVLPPTFTIERWVTAWMDGDDPKDILTKAHFEFAAHNDVDEDPDLHENIQGIKDNIDPRIGQLIDWGRCTTVNGRVFLAFKFEALSRKQKGILTDYVRGLGGLGEETDRDDNSLVLYENRAIAPEFRNEQGGLVNPEGSKLDMPSARIAVLEYFHGMKSLFGEE